VWKGAKIGAACASVAVGLVIRFLVPCPAAVDPRAWTLLAIFLSTITGLVLTPLPVGAWAFCGLSMTVVTKTLTFQQAFSAMTNDVIWLIVLAFFFAKGFVQTGLGDRVATFFVKILGKSTLGLSYGLSISEAILAPAMPSTTARAGGVYLPIIKSLAKNAGSEPGPTANKLGAFLVQTQLQSSGHSSAMCMTAAAQNLLSLKLAASLGIVVASPWLTWFKAACVPAIVGLAVTPLLVFKMFPPEIQDTPDAPVEAAKKLEKLGPLSQDELMVCVTMGLTVVLWIFGDAIGMSSVTAAMLGMSLQLVSGVISWADCLNEKGAWDTLLWFAVLIGMSSQLNQMGFIGFLSDTVAANLAKLSMGWGQVFVLLHACYFFIHYLFASQTAQVAALSTAFMAMMIASGAPPLLAGLTMAFHTNLFGAITHYASGQGAVYFGAGYVDLPTTFKLGGVLGVVNLLIWGVIGGAWWKIIGLY
jgi:DASS family divalent anion:Na+ symporter